MKPDDISIGAALQALPPAVLRDDDTPQEQTSARVEGRAALGPPRSLAEALAWYGSATSDHPRRAYFRAAFRLVGRALGRPLENIPADPALLQPLLREVVPSMVGVKHASWLVMKSSALQGVRALYAQPMPGRDPQPLDPTWSSLLKQLDDPLLAIGMCRLLCCFSRLAVTPHQVDLAAFDAFGCELKRVSVRTNSESIYRHALLNWNQAVSSCPAWPQVVAPVPNDPRRYSLDWDAFPASFVAEVEAYLSAKGDPDPLSDDYSRAIRPATAHVRRKFLRQIASALALSGAAPCDRITSLSVLTEIEHARAALRFVRDRHPDRDVLPSQLTMALLLRTVARDWVKDVSQTMALKSLIAALGGPRGCCYTPQGITAKNRARLRQFDVPQNVDALIGLPLRVLREIRRAPVTTFRGAVHVMYALQIGILTCVPIHAKHLAGLRLGINILDVGEGPRRNVRLHLPAQEMRTHRDYDAPIPPHLFPLLDAWVGFHRQQVCPTASPYLFPTRDGALRSREALSATLVRFVRRETGLTINLHLFRHVAAKLFLDHDPSGLEIVRQLLGHASMRTTLRVYAEMQTDPAFNRFEDALLGSVSRLNGPQPPKRSMWERRL